jgi:hypothetical protein
MLMPGRDEPFANALHRLRDPVRAGQVRRLRPALDAGEAPVQRIAADGHGAVARNVHQQCAVVHADTAGCAHCAVGNDLGIAHGRDLLVRWQHDVGAGNILPGLASQIIGPEQNCLWIEFIDSANCEIDVDCWIAPECGASGAALPRSEGPDGLIGLHQAVGVAAADQHIARQAGLPQPLAFVRG